MDLKEFLERKESASQKGVNYVGFSFKEQYPFFVEQLGLFFWERGGKQFVIYCKKAFNITDLNKVIQEAEATLCYPHVTSHRVDKVIYARDFLDALACLGEEKVKELIKGLEKK